MTQRVRITDVSPRDGLQNEPAPVATASKVTLVQLLCAAGVDEVEVTSFVSPTWVPQLADADLVLDGVRDFAEGVRHVAGAMPARSAPSGPHAAPGLLPVFSVLVPNEKGFERALSARERGLDLKISVFTAASETFNQKNTNATIAQSIERFRAFVPRALEMGLSLRAYVSCAVACPFEGRIEPSRVRAVADQLLALAPDDASRAAIEIDLGDTIGVATPQDIDALLRAFEPAQRQALTLHLHDTFGRATLCVRNALNMGVASFDGSAGGLGGCPYAGTPERRAPGNIDTLALVGAVHAAGFATGVDLDLLAEAGAFAASLRAPAGGAA